ncbi:MAG: MotA/TolQ/ExbB proton channel family protein [Candidatus Eisenbacteria bacterium]
MASIGGKNGIQALMIGAFLGMLLLAAPLGAQEGMEAAGDTGAGMMEDTAAFMEETPAAEESLAGGAGFADVEEDSGFFARLAKSGLVQLFDQGGNFMWPLLACSIIGLAVLIERLVTLFRAKVNVRKLIGRVVEALNKDGVDGAMRVCQETRGPIAAILHAGLLKARYGRMEIEKAIETAGAIEMSFLERGLIVLSSIVTIAPLIGFLGTVSGMIRAFNDIAAAEQVNAKIVASGISEALITTATGLIIAIPCQAAYNFFVAQIDRFVIEMEEAASEMIESLVALEGK